MTKTQKWLLGIFIGGFLLFVGLLFVVLVAALLSGGELSFAGSLGERVGVLELQGVIRDSENFNRQLKELNEDDNVRALVVRIDSPGGGVAASQEIYQALRKVRDKGDKPVVVSMGSLAASGGYYAACAGDSILAVPGTLTGSIGVILEFPDLHEILRKVGLGFEVIKSGEHKDIGSPMRPLTEEERRLLQEMVDDVFDQFLEVVSQERNLSRDSVLALADGRIFSGRQAAALGLVDRLGGFQDAVDMAGRMCGLGENPKTVRPKKKRTSILDFLTETAAAVKDPASGLISPSLMYIFR